jgi:hypothetical protein
LILFVSSTGSSSAPAIISGWNRSANSLGASATAQIYWTIATGGDAAPTVAAVASSIAVAHLEEWSGAATVSTNDQAGTSSGASTSPVTVTLGAADAAPAELVAMAGADKRSAARTTSDTWTSNHGTPTLRASNNGVNTTDHYSQATLITNSNSGADTAVMTLSITTSITGLAVAALSFEHAPAVADAVPRSTPYPQVLPQ